MHFVLIGDPMPNGGIFERFAGLELPSLGIDFYGATPSNAYPTTVYTTEYDFWADFPHYPLNLLSDLNSIKSSYPLRLRLDSHTAAGADATQLTTTGATQTTYYMIQHDELPLLAPLRDNIPIIGNPIADLLQPDLTYLVNLGYGDPLYGWSTSPANVPTSFGLFPPLSSFKELPALLASGAGQGIHDFIGDFSGTGPHPVTLPSLNSITSLLNVGSGTGGVTSALTQPAHGVACRQR